MGRREKLQWDIKHFWGDGYVHYGNYGDGFTGIHMSKLIQLCIFKTYSLLFLIYTSIK